MPATFNAKSFINELKQLQSNTELQKYERIFRKDISKGDKFIGIQMGKIFKLAKEYIEMPIKEISELLDSDFHDVRVGAVSIMDYQARSKKLSIAEKKKIFDLYIKKHDRINTWDLVDRSCIYVIGGYLFESNSSRDILKKLAKSKKDYERRTSIVSTAYFIRNHEYSDTIEIAKLLLKEEDELVQKSAGWMLRNIDNSVLTKFLDKYSSIMPKAMLRNAIEKMDKSIKDKYLKLKNS